RLCFDSAALPRLPACAGAISLSFSFPGYLGRPDEDQRRARGRIAHTRFRHLHIGRIDVDTHVAAVHAFSDSARGAAAGERIEHDLARKTLGRPVAVE